MNILNNKLFHNIVYIKETYLSQTNCLNNCNLKNKITFRTVQLPCYNMKKIE